MSEALTGRLLVLLSDGPARASVAALRRAAGRQVATTLDVRSGALPPEQIAGADAVYFHRLGVALVNVDPRDTERSARIRAAADENAARILAARDDAQFTSIEDVWRRSGVPVASLARERELIAQAAAVGVEINALSGYWLPDSATPEDDRAGLVLGAELEAVEAEDVVAVAGGEPALLRGRSPWPRPSPA